MRTRIHISRKLESIVPKELILIHTTDYDSPFGKWNATLFHVSRKKCLIITNSTARYSVLIDDLKKSDFALLTQVFIKNFYNQLLTDQVEIDMKDIIKYIGEINIFTTDNDRPILGTQNSVLEYLEDWKYEFGPIENWDFREINRRINGIVYKQIGWLTPREKIKIDIENINANA